MLPVVAIVGRPNVGKSTLFNVLTRSHAALVADVPGVTRDRQYGYARLGHTACVLIDTGGLIEHAQGMQARMRVQTERAVAEADRILLVLDARAGLTADDVYIASLLRRSGKAVTVALNKTEGLDSELAGAEFYRLGFQPLLPIAAAHARGCRELLDAAFADLEPAGDESEPGQAGAAAVAGRAGGTHPAARGAEAVDESGAIRIAIVGRPNVGKSTLINRLAGEERVIASAEPATTRDSIGVPLRRDGRELVLVDTAGMRRRARVGDALERAGAARTLQAIAEAHVVVVMLDAHEQISEQDASVLGLALERGRALLIAVNKWDGIGAQQRVRIRNELDLKLNFVPFAPVHYVSALRGTGIASLMRDAVRAHDAAMRELPTPALTRVLEQAQRVQAPPLVRGRRIKLRYAHQGGRNPPRIVVHGNQTGALPASYRRFLANAFRDAFDLHATPVAIELRSEANPFQPPGTRKRGARQTAGKATRAMPARRTRRSARPA